MRAIFVLWLAIASSTMAEPSLESPLSPQHSPHEVIDATLKHLEKTSDNVRITHLSFDYLKQVWHIELTPTDINCLDCLPSIYIKNKSPINVETIPHG